MSNASRVISELSGGNYSDDVLFQALQLTGERQAELFTLARSRRDCMFPDSRVQVRSVIETSNICRQHCRYCAIGGTSQTKDYTLSSEAIIRLGEYLYSKGRRVLLLQSGENVNDSFISSTGQAVERLKSEHPDIRIILCMGNLTEEQYRQLYLAGASDYILKFETSNADLFAKCKPADTLKNRISCIQILKRTGFHVGSGNIVGLPGQTLEDLVNDLKLVHRLPLDMNSATIFVPAENTLFALEPPGNPTHTLNMMALMRIMNPQRLMPTTSSLEKMIPDGQYLGLLAGANTVTIHDGTPDERQQYFPIYSSKRIRPQIEHFKDILGRAGMRTDNII